MPWVVSGEQERASERRSDTAPAPAEIWQQSTTRLVFDAAENVDRAPRRMSIGRLTVWSAGGRVPWRGGSAFGL
eukprot:4718032-Prymnesium_polylepis.1